jgi:hypothetical protein
MKKHEPLQQCRVTVEFGSTFDMINYFITFTLVKPSTHSFPLGSNQ